MLYNTSMYPVVFVWKKPCKSAEIAGDFNHWKPQDMVYKEQAWQMQVNLNEGTCEYKYIIDGIWQIDESQPVEYDAHHNQNNAIVVHPSSPLREKRQ